MVKRNSIISIILSVFLAFVVLFTGIMPVVASADDSSSSSSSATIEYSNVLDDLKKDSSFDETLYPAYTYEALKEKELALMDVISLAEGEHKELFLYVYNPTRKDLGLTAYQVSMYCSYAASPKDFDVTLYGLNLVSFEGVFDKYLVMDFEVSNEADRYYNIVEISRPFNADIDSSIENGYTEDKAISIGKQWYCYYYNGELIYEMGKFSVLEITPTLNSNILYQDGLTASSFIGEHTACNSHFIAFNCDNYIIKQIFDADLTYQYRKKQIYTDFFYGTDTVSYPDGADYLPQDVTLTEKDEVTYEGKGLFGKTFTWNRITTPAEFITHFEEQGGKLNEESKEILLKSQWVFAFAETDWSRQDDTGNIYGNYWTTYTEVARVDILRISFLDITGKYYNLGVVGDKTTADNTPDGGAGGLDLSFIDDWFEKLLAILLVIGLVVLYGTFLAPFVNPIISMIIKAAFKGIGIVIKLVFKIITLPLRLLFGLFKR